MHARASLALLRRRPDIITSKRHLAASNVRVGAAVADYYPDADRQLLAAQDQFASDNGERGLSSRQVFPLAGRRMPTAIRAAPPEMQLRVG